MKRLALITTTSTFIVSLILSILLSVKIYNDFEFERQVYFVEGYNFGALVDGVFTYKSAFKSCEIPVIQMKTNVTQDVALRFEIEIRKIDGDQIERGIKKYDAFAYVEKRQETKTLIINGRQDGTVDTKGMTASERGSYRPADWLCLDPGVYVEQITWVRERGSDTVIFTAQSEEFIIIKEQNGN